MYDDQEDETRAYRAGGFSQADLRMLADFTDGGRVMRDVVMQYSDDVRVSVGGFIHRVLGKHHTLVPAIGLDVAAAVRQAAGEVREDMLQGLLLAHPDREWARAFREEKCVVPVAGRPGEFVVERRIPGLTDEPLECYSDDVSDVPAVFVDKRKYSLDQFFSDEDVLEKFPLSEKFLQTVRRCAVGKPHAAAEMIQKTLRSLGYVGVSVHAGKFIKSRKRAAAAIVQAARRLTNRDNGVWSVTVEGKIYYYHDDASEVLRWSVEGPLSYALEVKCVYDLCLAVGVDEAMQMLCFETALLGIAVRDEMRAEYVTGILESHVNMAGIEPIDNHVAPGLTPDQHATLTAMHDRVMPVTMDDKVVATAVRVTEKYALVCDHVIVEAVEAQDLRVGGGVFRQEKTVGNDLWVVAADGGLQRAWSLRDGRIGEKVVLVYSVGEHLEVTSPVPIVAVNGTDLALNAPSQLRKGMSGAAVVALSDMALLGVYRGKTAGRAVVTAFGQDKYGDLADVELTSQASVPGQADADDVAARYARRGYGAAFRAAVAAVTPLYDGENLVGAGVCYGTDLVTPVDPDVHALRLGGPTGRAPVFDATSDGRFFSPVDRVEVNSVPVQARPAVDQRVVILAKDTVGIYMSEVCTIRRLGVSARKFYIDAPEYEVNMPLTGGLVLSYDTAAVIGQYCGKVIDVGGAKGVCVTTFKAEAVKKVAARTVVEGLSDKFPMLTPIAWEVGAVDAVFAHPAGNNLTAKRAMVGDAIMRVVAAREMERAGWPVSAWTTSISRWQSNAALAEVAATAGLADMMKVEPGYVVPPGSKRLADLIEALVGLTWLHEKWNVVVEFCKALGVVPRETPEDLLTPTSAHFPLAMSPEMERQEFVNSSSDEAVIGSA